MALIQWGMLGVEGRAVVEGWGMFCVQWTLSIPPRYHVISKEEKNLQDPLNRLRFCDSMILSCSPVTSWSSNRLSKFSDAFQFLDDSTLLLSFMHSDDSAFHSWTLYTWTFSLSWVWKMVGWHHQELMIPWCIVFLGCSHKVPQTRWLK